MPAIPTIRNAQLAREILDLELLPKEQVLDSLRQARADKVWLGDLLIKRGILSDKKIGRIVADYLHLPFLDMEQIQLTDTLQEATPPEFAAHQHVLAFKQAQGGKFVISTSNPFNLQALTQVRKKIGSNYRLSYATAEDIESVASSNLSHWRDELESMLAADKLTTETVPEIIDILFKAGFNAHASDIHITPLEEDIRVRFRLDGKLHDQLTLPQQYHDTITSRVKVMAGLRTDEHASAQDGKIQFTPPGSDDDLDVRISILPTIHGENIVLRLLLGESEQYTLDELGMSTTDLTTTRAGLSEPNGMILSTGPTGSGKTTTMYSLLKILNTSDRHITTIEDPVEYEIAGITQTQVNPQTNLTFAKGLRSILRQDPDIIFVGEVRDEETATIAVNAALTGHLVLSTLHTNNAVTTIQRMIEMGIEPFLIASTVKLVIAQRLVRKVCTECRVSRTYQVAELTHIHTDTLRDHWGNRDAITVYEGKGCDVCGHSGYLGRVGVFEVLPITDQLRDVITNDPTPSALQAAAAETGMTTMLADGLKKVEKGITTLEEVFRVAKEHSE